MPLFRCFDFGDQFGLFVFLFGESFEIGLNDIQLGYLGDTLVPEGFVEPHSGFGVESDCRAQIEAKGGAVILNQPGDIGGSIELDDEKLLD